MATARRRLASIMFADMVGYSALAQRNESLALELLDEYRQVLREEFGLHGGREIDSVGDGFFVEFGSAVEAAKCAIAIQKAITDRNAVQPLERRVQVRIGLHLGDVVVEGERVVGDGVNIAARIEPLAEPGGICVSEDVARQIQNKIELPLLRLGKADLKNIQLPVGIYRLVLPWQRKHWPGAERLAFSLRQRQVRRAMFGAGGLLIVAGVVGTWAWKSAHTRIPPTNNRIAVLPFLSMSASADDEYFADGITEELISRLSRVRGLEVIARTSIASYKGTKKKIREIGEELTVGTVLEGSVRKAGSKVRITAQLINANSDAHLWSEDYDRELKDVFVVQGDIAQRVTDSLATRLGALSVPTLPGGTRDLEAYDAYLKGRYYYNKGSPEDLQKAVTFFEEATKRDAAFALAYAGIADTYEQLAGYYGNSTERMPKARQAALKSIELDESVAEGHTALGVVLAFYDWEFANAEEAFTRALALNPNSEVVHDWYGWYLLWSQRWDEAIGQLRKAVALDPLSLIMKSDLGFALVHAGRWDEAIDQSRRMFELDPDNSWASALLGWAYIGKGMYRDALKGFEKAVDGSYQLAITYGLLGDTTRSLKLLDEITAASNGNPRAWYMTEPYRALASQDRQYESQYYSWLGKAYDEHDVLLVWTSSRHAVTGKPNDSSDPRWIAFRKRLGLLP